MGGAVGTGSGFARVNLSRERAGAWLKSQSANAVWSSAVALVFALMDLAFTHWINPNYRFASIFSLSAVRLFAVAFLLSYMGAVTRRSALGLLFFLSLSQILFFNYYGTYIQPINYLQLLPDFGLIAASFFETIEKAYAAFALTAGAAALLVLVEFAFPPKRTARLAVPVLVGLLGFNLFTTYQALNTPGKKITGAMSSRLLPGPNRLGVDNAYRSLRYLAVGILPKRWSERVLADRPLPAPAIVKRAPRVNIVLVIGETVRASQLGILGYKGNDTTPLLRRVDGLFAKPIYSAGTMTRTSWVGLLNRLERPGLGEQFNSQSNCLFRLAKLNGFKTRFVYAYDALAAHTLRSFMCPTYIDEFLSNSDFPESRRRYDRNLLAYLSEVDLDEPSFIILGPRGAHTPYKEMTPNSLKKFASDYDNAIAYTDRILNAMIKRLRQRSKIPTYFIFTSDHGELLEGETDRLRHGWFRENVIKVPFLFVALNQKNHGLLTVLPSVDSHFDLSTLVVGLMGYDVQVNAGPKRVFINGSDVYGLAGHMTVDLDRGKVTGQTVSEW